MNQQKRFHITTVFHLSFSAPEKITISGDALNWLNLVCWDAKLFRTKPNFSTFAANNQRSSLSPTFQQWCGILMGLLKQKKTNRQPFQLNVKFNSHCESPSPFTLYAISNYILVQKSMIKKKGTESVCIVPIVNDIRIKSRERSESDQTLKSNINFHKITIHTSAYVHICWTTPNLQSRMSKRRQQKKTAIRTVGVSVGHASCILKEWNALWSDCI